MAHGSHAPPSRKDPGPIASRRSHREAEVAGRCVMAAVGTTTTAACTING